MVLSLPVLDGPFTNDPPAGLTTVALLLQDSPRDLGLHHELLPLASGPFPIGALILHDRPHLLGELGCVQEGRPECREKRARPPGRDEIAHIAPHVKPRLLVGFRRTLRAPTKTPLIRPDTPKTDLRVRVLHQHKVNRPRLTNVVRIRRGTPTALLTTSTTTSKNPHPTTPPAAHERSGKGK